MPSRYTIYGPWLEDAAERDRIEQLEKYLLEVNRQLRERGVSTVNALPLYRSSVEEQLATGQLLFYREDNHWNLQGVELIARALADSIRSSPVIQDQVKAARTANLTK
jgi:SGNH hydrolase-like domain, acetyltransferase AlgX